jgi:Spy/CpxP family protein refolding chaperone
MNTALKWKLVVGFLLVFLAGAAAGGFLAVRQMRHPRADFAHSHHWLTEHMRSRMQTELNLTPEQIVTTAPIFDRAASELEKVHAETGERVRQIIAEANRALAPELTDAQRVRLEALEKRPRPDRKLRNAPRHRGPCPPGQQPDND